MYEVGDTVIFEGYCHWTIREIKDLHSLEKYYSIKSPGGGTGGVRDENISPTTLTMMRMICKQET